MGVWKDGRVPTVEAEATAQTTCPRLPGREVGKLGFEPVQCDSRICIFTHTCHGLPERFKTKSEELQVAILTLKRMYLVIT